MTRWFTHHGLDIEAARTSESKRSQNYLPAIRTQVYQHLWNIQPKHARASKVHTLCDSHWETQNAWLLPCLSVQPMQKGFEKSQQNKWKFLCWVDLNLQLTWSFTISGWDAKNRLVEVQELLPREPWYLENPELDRPVCGLQSTKCLNKNMCQQRGVFSCLWLSKFVTNMLQNKWYWRDSSLNQVVHMLGLISLISCSLYEFNRRSILQLAPTTEPLSKHLETKRMFFLSMRWVFGAERQIWLGRILVNYLATVASFNRQISSLHMSAVSPCAFLCVSLFGCLVISYLSYLPLFSLCSAGSIAAFWPCQA